MSNQLLSLKQGCIRCHASSKYIQNLEFERDTKWALIAVQHYNGSRLLHGYPMCSNGICCFTNVLMVDRLGDSHCNKIYAFSYLKDPSLHRVLDMAPRASLAPLAMLHMCPYARLELWPRSRTHETTLRLWTTWGFRCGVYLRTTPRNAARESVCLAALSCATIDTPQRALQFASICWRMRLFAIPCWRTCSKSDV